MCRLLQGFEDFDSGTTEAVEGISWRSLDVHDDAVMGYRLSRQLLVAVKAEEAEERHVCLRPR